MFYNLFVFNVTINYKYVHFLPQLSLYEFYNIHFKNAKLTNLFNKKFMFFIVMIHFFYIKQILKNY